MTNAQAFTSGFQSQLLLRGVTAPYLFKYADSVRDSQGHTTGQSWQQRRQQQQDRPLSDQLQDLQQGAAQRSYVPSAEPTPSVSRPPATGSQFSPDRPSNPRDLAKWISMGWLRPENTGGLSTSYRPGGAYEYALQNQLPLGAGSAQRAENLMMYQTGPATAGAIADASPQGRLQQLGITTPGAGVDPYTFARMFPARGGQGGIRTVGGR